MKRLPLVPLALAVAGLLLCSTGELGGYDGVTREPGAICLVVPPFAGEEPLGQRVATVLNLQMWQTLQRGARGRFGKGQIVWSPQPLSQPSFAAAEEMAEAKGCELVLWGRAWRYGNEVVVQAYLSILDRASKADVDLGAASKEPHILWRSSVNVAGFRTPLELGFPRTRYEFAPIVLTADVVDEYTDPSALQVFKTERFLEPLELALGAENFRAIEQHSDRAWIETENGRGWVKLPKLGESRTEVVDFAGAVIRMIRGDWAGAETLFQRVIDNPATPTSLKIDSLLSQAVALENQADDGGERIWEAYRLNPHSRATARYGMMKRLSAVYLDGPAALEGALRDTRHLFSADDFWVTTAESVLSQP